MIKLCVLGNSHTASLKLGWDMITHQYPNVEITFFANRQRKMEAFRVEKNSLVPDNEELKNAIAYTSGGLTSINMQYYDVCLLYGLDLDSYQLPETFFSVAVLKEAMLECVSSSVSWGLLHKIRKTSDKAIFLGHTPLHATTNDTAEQGDVSAYQAGIKLMNQSIFREYNALIIEQPIDTIDNMLQTMLKYSVGSTRLDLGDETSNQLHPAQENKHMNAQFGVHYLDAFLKTIC